MSLSLKAFLILFLQVIFYHLTNAQEGLFLGLKLGPVKNLLEERIVNVPEDVNGRVSFAQSIYFHGGFNDHLALRTGIDHVAMGVSMDKLNGGYSIGLDYFYWHFGVNLRTSELGASKIGQRIFINQCVSITYMNTGEKYLNQNSSVGVNQIIIDSVVHKQRNWGLKASLGLEFLLMKESFITLDFIYNIGSRDIHYYVLPASDNKYASRGSYFSMFIGYKMPVRNFLKKNKNEI